MAKTPTAQLMRRYDQAHRLRKRVEKVEKACLDQLKERLGDDEVLTSAAGKFWLEPYETHQWDTAELQILMDRSDIPKRLYMTVTRKRPKLELKTFRPKTAKRERRKAA